MQAFCIHPGLSAPPSIICLNTAVSSAAILESSDAFLSPSSFVSVWLENNFRSFFLRLTSDDVQCSLHCSSQISKPPDGLFPIIPPLPASYQFFLFDQNSVSCSKFPGYFYVFWNEIASRTSWGYPGISRLRLGLYSGGRGPRCHCIMLLCQVYCWSWISSPTPLAQLCCL